MSKQAEAKSEVAGEAEKKAPAPLNIHEAMLAVYRQVGYVEKKGKIDSGSIKYKFAGEAEFIAALRPAMIEAGVYQSPLKMDALSNDRIETIKVWDGKETKSYQHRVVIHVDYRFQHAATNTHIIVPAFGEAMDSGDKAFNKAMTAANKYALRQAFMIETGEDPDKYASKEEGGVDDGKVEKIFANAALRNTFCGNVINSFGKASTVDELKTLWEIDGEKLARMSAGGEHDKLAYEELLKQYRMAGKRINELKKQVQAEDERLEAFREPVNGLTPKDDMRY